MLADWELAGVHVASAAAIRVLLPLLLATESDCPCCCCCSCCCITGVSLVCVVFSVYSSGNNPIAAPHMNMSVSQQTCVTSCVERALSWSGLCVWLCGVCVCCELGQRNQLIGFGTGLQLRTLPS